MCWTLPETIAGGKTYLGYAHGAAGIADALLDLFEAVAIDEVFISFMLDSRMELQLCSIRIDVWCFFDVFPLQPEELENIEFAVEDRISSILLELFGEVIVDEVRIDFPK